MHLRIEEMIIDLLYCMDFPMKFEVYRFFLFGILALIKFWGIFIVLTCVNDLNSK